MRRGARSRARPRSRRRVWTRDERYAGLRLNEYAESARRFVWNELADWYLEAAKARLARAGRGSRRRARGARARLRPGAAAAASDRAVHDRGAVAAAAAGRRESASFSARAEWPSRARRRSTDASRVRARARRGERASRRSRAEYNVPPAKLLHAVLVSTSSEQLYHDECEIIASLGRATLSVCGRVDGPAVHTLLADGSDLAVSLGGLVDCRRRANEDRDRDRRNPARAGGTQFAAIERELSFARAGATSSKASARS